MGGPNAGFTSLSAALRYLQSHPNETVWAMNWDAPSRPKDKQINENMVLLVLAGPNYKTERDALAWIGYPATRSTTETFGVGTRIEKPSTLPPNSGMTSFSALAAPVEVGIMLIAAARARRRSLCGKSRIT